MLEKNQQIAFFVLGNGAELLHICNVLRRETHS